MTKTRSLAALLLLGLTMTVLASCSGGAEDSAPASAGGDVAREAPAEAPEFAEGGSGDGEQPGDQPGANRTVVTVRSVIKTGEVSLTRDDLDAARSDLGDLLDALGGFVDSETTEHDRSGDIERSTVVVRVPVTAFEPAMERIEDLGRKRHSETRSEDVTQRVIDVDERVETLQNSLDRLQDYQREAEDIDDLIRFEDQITQRESELQSLRAQQAYLTDQTSMSTITVHMSTPDKYVPPPSALEDAGFLAGLKGGWDALKDTVVVVLTVVGAVLPFALVLLLVGVPAWLLVRRTLQTRTAPAVSADAPPAE